MRNLAYIFVFVLMACEITPNEDSIGVYPDKIISENFIGNFWSVCALCVPR